MRELSLFTGAGGGIWGTRLLGWQTVGYVEFEDYPQRVIAQRIKDGHFDDAPIYGDIRTFLSEGYAESYKGMVDVITAGFPCQPFSVAGKKLGSDDARNMWPATMETICRVSPRYVLLENVPGLASAFREDLFTGLLQSGQSATIGKWYAAGDLETLQIILPAYVGRIFADLSEGGYDAGWKVISAGELGAPHKRDRLWIVAESKEFSPDG